MANTVQQYLDYVRAPWGRIFYDLLWNQLDQHVPSHRVSILDVGCGFARTAIRLAERGHAVVAVDPAAAFLELARQEAAARSADLTFLAAGVENLGQPGLEGRFDWVLCHNVLEYVADPALAVKGLVGHIAPGGYLSLVVHNPVSHVIGTIVHEMDPRAALRKKDATTSVVQTLNRSVHHHPKETILAWIQGEGLEVVAYYGMRCLFDYVSDNERKRDPEWYQEMLALEQHVAAVSPYREIAKFIHIVARRGRGSHG